MIRINLLPQKEAERAVGRRQQMAVLVLGVTVTLLLMIVPYLVQRSQLSQLDGQIDVLQDEIRRYDEKVKEVKQLDRLKKDLRTKLRVIRDLDDKRIGPARMLIDLAGAVPESLWLLDVSETDGGATLTGIGLDNETIARFMRQLQASAYFFRVDLVETSRSTINVPSAAGTEEASLTRFIINAGIDYFGRGGKPAESDEAAEDGSPGEPST